MSALLSRVGHEHFHNTPLDQLLEEEFSYEDSWKEKGTAVLYVCYVTSSGRYGSARMVRREQLIGRSYKLYRCVGTPHICIEVYDADFDPKKWKVINPL